MEEKEGFNSSGFTIRSDEASENYKMAPRNETTNGFSESVAAVTPVNLVSMATPSTEVKKKRGRPKKYGPDGSVNTALSPMPISASIPLSGDFSGWKNSGSRPVESFKKKQKFELSSSGERVPYSAAANFSPHVEYSGGANFTPHVINVNAGELQSIKHNSLCLRRDEIAPTPAIKLPVKPSMASSNALGTKMYSSILKASLSDKNQIKCSHPRTKVLQTPASPVSGSHLYVQSNIICDDVAMKIISFAQQGSRAICVLAANGAISNVTLGQPNSSGGTLTYEGRFEILSLTGSYMSIDNGITKTRTGGMSVSLSGPDGRVIGGGLAGMLIAAGPIQVVIGSFIPGHQQEQEPKKQGFEHATTFAAIPATTSVYAERTNEAYTRPSHNFTSSTTFPGDNTVSLNSIHSSRISAVENNISMRGEESNKEQSPSS